MIDAHTFLNQAATQSTINKNLQKADEVEKTSLEFVEMFFRTCLSQIFKEDNHENGGFFGEGHAAEMWKHLFINEIAKSTKGKTGLEEPIKKALIKKVYQEKSNEKQLKGKNLHETV